MPAHSSAVDNTKAREVARRAMVARGTPVGGVPETLLFDDRRNDIEQSQCTSIAIRELVVGEGCAL